MLLNWGKNPLENPHGNPIKKLQQKNHEKVVCTCLLFKFEFVRIFVRIFMRIFFPTNSLTSLNDFFKPSYRSPTRCPPGLRDERRAPAARPRIPHPSCGARSDRSEFKNEETLFRSWKTNKKVEDIAQKTFQFSLVYCI